ncbi:ABC transporter ATP-binding protein [Cucumibacter marinus]|uniref:ABC transporter ATP-binding protein n=1 Tax=Cucumibacter marinus TaxID=1121252 RepID=UPI0003F72D1D|nr:ABC transporter ATP-binding protein [Cucumibacter marinus]
MVSISARNIGLNYRIPRKLTLAPRDRRMAAGGRIESSGSGRIVKALEGVTFSLRSGDRLGLVGPNGAGKTTLLKVLYGIFEPSAGELHIDGRVDALFNITLGFRTEATGRRNIELRGLINGWTKQQIAARMDEIIEFSELGEFIDMPFKAYSQGMAARLAFSVATTLQPEILLMDEWIGAGDAGFQDKATARMDEIAQKAGIIVLASHNQSLIEQTCNKVLRLEKGRAGEVLPIGEYARD